MTFRKHAKRWLYGSCPVLAGSFPYFGTRVFFPRHSLIFTRACAEGIFESSVLRKILALVRPGTTYLDIGANIGLMSVPILATLCDVQVLSFEPSPASLSYLERTRRNSSFADRWRIVGKAVSGTGGHRAFFTSASCGGALDGLQDTGRSIAPTQVQVELTTVDRVWIQQGKPAVSCIKIDVEGAELGALNGARDCLEKERPSVVLEWNAENLAAHNCVPEALLDFANELQFDIVGLNPFSVILSRAMLRLVMNTCENFLLLPR